MQYRPHRYRSDYTVQVDAPMGQLRAAISNVNEGGAQLRDTCGLRAGDPVQFNVLQNRISGVVQWATGTSAGLAFHPQITVDQIDAIRNRIDGRRRMPPGPAGLQLVL